MKQVMQNAQRPPTRRFERMLAGVCILLGLSLTGAAAIGAPPSRLDQATIEEQRARFARMAPATATPPPVTTLDTGALAETATPTSTALPPPGVADVPTLAPPEPIDIERLARLNPVVESMTPPPPPPVDMPSATWISIPAVGVDTAVIEVEPKTATIEGQLALTWQVADWAAGHHVTSADPGEGGNIVIAGHDDVRGEVFRGLHDIEIGDEVRLTSPAGEFRYAVVEAHLRRERDVPLEERLAAGVFLAPMPEERLTLVTCWPYGVDDHRLIVVAKPAPRSTAPDAAEGGP